MTPRHGSSAQLEAFSDRVMAAIALAAAPSPTRSFVTAIRAGSGRDAVTALSVAWHLATQREWPVAPRVRARSLALILAVATILATGSMVAASAARVIAPHVDRTEILESRGSIIVEPAPDDLVPTSPGRPSLAPVAVPVSVAISKKAHVSTSGHASPSTPKTAGHGGTSGHDAEHEDGDAATSSDPSDDGGGTHQSDDGAGSGTPSHDASDGAGSGAAGDDGSATGDGHTTDDDGGTPGD